MALRGWQLLCVTSLMMVSGRVALAQENAPRKFSETYFLRTLTSSNVDKRLEAINRITENHQGDRRMADVLVEVLQTQITKNGENRVDIALYRLLRHFPQPQVDEFLAKQLGVANPRVVIITLDEMRQRKGFERYLNSVHQLTERPDFPNNFGLRVSILETIMRAKTNEAIDCLIARLADLDGKSLDMVVRHLQQTTGQFFGENVDAWKNWWNQEKQRFQIRKTQKGGTSDNGNWRPPVAHPDDEVSMSSFFDLQITAKRVIFVIDRSNSMKTALPVKTSSGVVASSRLFQAQQELIRAIHGLPDDAEFNILVFDHRVKLWRGRFAHATRPNKLAAFRFISTISSGGETAWYDALELALNTYPNLEAIYFLSDGEPTVGKIVSAPKILKAITEENHFHRAAIHTIGLGAGPFASRFLQALADQNQGTFREIGIQRPAPLKDTRPKGNRLAFRPTRALNGPMRPLTRVRSLSARIAGRRLTAKELVLGVKINQQTRAYPLNMMTGPSREVINDVLGNTPIVATW